MKKALSLLMVFFYLNSSAQSTVGLIAHWDLDGEALDVSSNGHNGTLHNVTPDTGISGIPGTAYYFNGVNSYISAPYMPDLNLSKYTICAIVKVNGFYSGTCQSNCIFTRGDGLGHSVGSYNLAFDDNHFDSSCSHFDSTINIFYCSAYNLVPGSYLASTYTPTISENKWYKIVGIFNDTTYRLYINDTLKNIASITTPGMPIGTSTDSISIGYSLYSAGGGFPYGFKGLIDDIRIYNRVLSDSEVAHYGDTCGIITTQPAVASTHIGGNATYTVNTTIAGATYQWQQDGGTGFVNLSNAGPYSGVFTNTLSITGIAAAISGDYYRCLISNSWGCADTTVQALLTTGVENINFESMVNIYPNPTDDKVSICIKNIANNYSYKLVNELGQQITQNEINENITAIDLSKFPSGIYFLRVQIENQIVYKKILKY